MSSKDPQFWIDRYSSGTTPWNLGQVAPPFKNLLETNHITPGKMAVLGSGYGHDAAFFGQHGFDVTGFDYVSEAIESASQKYGRWSRFVQADIFKLPEQYSETFDYVLEHTCFCAIPIIQRKDYVKLVYRLLKPGGCYIALFWAHNEMGGPPYKTDRHEITDLFNGLLDLKSLEISQYSSEDRKNQELLGIFRRKN